MRTEAITATSPASNESPFAMPLPDVIGFGLCGEVVVCNDVSVVRSTSTLLVEAAVTTVNSDVDVATVSAGIDVDVAMVVNPLGLATFDVKAMLDPAVTDNAVAVTEDNVRPGVRGCVSRDARSDAWNRIWRAGPTVNESSSSSLAVAPQTPPRKSVVSLVQDWPLFYRFHKTVRSGFAAEVCVVCSGLPSQCNYSMDGMEVSQPTSERRTPPSPRPG